MSASTIQARKTIEDLARTEGKAELIGGRIVALMASGLRPNLVAGRILRSLDDFAEATGQGAAYTGGMGYAVAELPSGRESFCADVSYYDGPLPSNPMSFVQGPPTFAVEVRSEGDYGPAAERAILAKRLDYFAAGTLAVWDVDPIAQVIHAYRFDAPEHPAVFTLNDLADAEPAMPGWRMAVARIFP